MHGNLPYDVAIVYYSYLRISAEVGYWVKEKQAVFFFREDDPTNCDHELVCIRGRSTNKVVCLKCGGRFRRAECFFRFSGYLQKDALKALQKKVTEIREHIKQFPFPHTIDD